MPPQLCPPNSPDLNPADNSIWEILQEKVYKTHITDLDELKLPLRMEWAKLDQVVIAPAIRRRLSAYVIAGDGQLSTVSDFRLCSVGYFLLQMLTT